MLFQVSDTNIFIIGSIHRQPEGFGLPSQFLSAISEADECYFESAPGGLPSAKEAKYPIWKPLPFHIPFNLFRATLGLCQRLELPRRDLGEVCFCKPWWIYLRLQDILKNRAGISGKNSIDSQLWEFARKSNKALFTLDSKIWEMFDSMPISEQIYTLDYLASDPDQEVADAKSLHDNWLKGDEKAIADALETGLKQTPVSTTRLILERNQKWFPTLLRAVEAKKKAVFVVGVLHVVGRGSLKELLKAEPYSRDLIRIQP